MMDFLESFLSFEYTTSLRSKKDPYIRLIQLHKRKILWDGINVTLTEHRFNHNLPVYDALSYAWGEDNKEETILCNKRKFKIGTVLYNALWWLTHPKYYEPRLIWIDRLCSNQADALEKSCQVGLMGDIFGRARMTIAWLGGQSRKIDNTAACSLLMFDMEARFAFEQTLKQHTSLQDVESSVGDYVAAKMEEYTLQVFDLDVVAFLSSPWFRRVWVMQEVKMAKKVIAMCKNVRIDFDNLLLGVMIMARALSEDSLPAPRIELTIDPTKWRRKQLARQVEWKKKFVGILNTANIVSHLEISLMTQLRHGGDDGEHLLLPKLLAATHRARATKIEDKLYSLYGMTRTDVQNLGLRPDYTVDAKKALIDATFSLLKSQTTLDLLELVESDKTDNQDMPSWVLAPYGPPLHGQGFIEHQKTVQHSLFNAAAEKMYKENPDIYPRLPPDKLGKVLQQFREANMEEKFLTRRMSTLPPSEMSLLNLDANNRLHLHGQLIDKVKEVQPSKFEGHVADRLSLSLRTPDFLNYLASTWDIRNFVRVLIDRDEMVMKHVETYMYPGHEKLLTAYRKTVCSGQDYLSEEEAEAAFQKLRSMLQGPAKWITMLQRALGINNNTAGIVTVATLRNQVDGIKSQATSRLWQLMSDNSFSRLLTWTEKGYLALVPAATQVGDTIAILKGGRLPFVMRPHEKQTGAWRLLGPAYIHGIMNGELSDDSLIETIKIA